VADQTGLFVNVNPAKFVGKVSSFATTPEGYYYPPGQSIFNEYKHRKSGHDNVVHESEQAILKQVAPMQLSWWLS
jgi:hypothetical protein